MRTTPELGLMQGHYNGLLLILEVRQTIEQQFQISALHEFSFCVQPDHNSGSELQEES